MLIYDLEFVDCWISLWYFYIILEMLGVCLICGVDFVFVSVYGYVIVF